MWRRRLDDALRRALADVRLHRLLKRHGPFVAFYLYCKIMLYGINYTYYTYYVFLYHLGVENRRSKGCLTLFTHRPRGVFETVVGVAKSPEANA